MTGRRVVVTGVGVVTPVGHTVRAAWDSLVNGKSGLSKIETFDVSSFATQIAGVIKDLEIDRVLDRKQAKRMDRFCQLGMMAAMQAVEDSGLDMASEDATRVGVYASSGIGGLATIETQHQLLLERGPGRISPLLVPMMIINLLPGNIAMHFGMKGPNLAVVTACATGNHNLGEALLAIRRGMADVVVSGGAEAPVTPLGLAGFCSMKAMSCRNDDPAGSSRPFDAERDGFVMSEGAAMLVLEELEHARARGARIYGELVGYGATSDAYHLTAPAPDGEGAARSMANALADAGVAAADVDYINAHGTSTPLNDKYETMAIKTVFGADASRVPVSSTKSVSGHLLGAAGAFEAIACLLTMREGVIPPTINYEHPDPECDLDYVPNQAREGKVAVAMSNSFGFGGHNSTLVFKAI